MCLVKWSVVYVKWFADTIFLKVLIMKMLTQSVGEFCKTDCTIRKKTHVLCFFFPFCCILYFWRRCKCLIFSEIGKKKHRRKTIILKCIVKLMIFLKSELHHHRENLVRIFRFSISQKEKQMRTSKIRHKTNT